jgi:hypothetical protein
MEQTQKDQDLLNRYLINNLDKEGVIRLKSVEFAVAFSHGKEMTPEQFAEVYESCNQFLNTINKQQHE